MPSVTGDRGHDQVDPGSAPVKIGGQAYDEPPAAVAVGDRTNGYFDLRGRQAVFIEPEESYETAFVNATASGNTQVVAADTTKKIQVVGVRVTNKDSSTIQVKFQSATTDIGPTDMLADNGGGYVDNPTQGFVMETSVNEALNINLSGVSSVGCSVRYRKVSS